MAKKNKIWIIAAGTGGHIYPGLALADELRKQSPDLEVEFWGSPDRLESELIPKHGYSVRLVHSSKWKGQGLLTKVFSFFAIMRGLVATMLILMKEGRPKFLLSVGGYLSVPLGIACWFFRVPIFILEPNSHAGIANRLLSRFARKAFSYEGSDSAEVMKCSVVNFGVPLRSEIHRVSIRPQVSQILIMGGSQGAKTLCSLGISLASKFKKANQNIKIILQAGKSNYQDIKQEVEKQSLTQQIEVKEYLDNVPEYYQKIDLIISRAGAMSVQEITASALPAIFIPFPFAADNHQVKNVASAKKAGAVKMFEENEDYISLTKKSVEELCVAEGNFEKRQTMSNALYEFAHPDSARKIAADMLDDRS